MTTVDLTDATFEETVTADGIVLVDFWAEWCGPCRRFAPVFEAAAEQHPDVVFGKVDTEAERELSAMAQISSIPTLMAFRDGICVFSQPGALPPAALEQVIEAVRGLDMDDVRRQVDAQQDAGEEDLETFAAAHAEGGYVLDVREPDEYVEGRVPGAIPMPMRDIPQHVAQLPRDRTIHVICHSGNRSRAVVDYLRNQGLDAVNVSAGTAGWAARGWAMDRG